MIERRVRVVACFGLASMMCFALTRAASAQCEVTCPPGASIESETCGDDTNGGCFMATPAFEPIACDETYCGTGWADEGAHDTDWYEIVTTEQMALTWVVEAEFPVVIGLIETTTPGSGNCEDMTGSLDPFAVGEPCEVVSVTTECLTAGTYWLYVSHQSYFDWPCGADNDYAATLTCAVCGVPLGACCFIDGSCTPDLAEYECEALDGTWQGEGVSCDPNPCPQPEIGDYCGLPLVVNLPAELPYGDISQYTCERVNNYQETCLDSYDGGEEIIYELNVTEMTDVEITLDPKTTEWTGIVLDDSCPPDEDCIALSTSQDASPHGLGCLRLTPGIYYVMVDTWPFPDCIEDFDLTIEACTVIGRCCYGSNPVQCADVGETDCLTIYEGEWTEGLNCTENPCPEPIGEMCEEATIIAAVPYFQSVDNDEAAADGPEGTCDKYYPTSGGVMQNDVWWVWTADSDCDATLTVTPTGYDAIVTVRDNCDDLTELYCADGGGTGEVEAIIFSAANGTTYYFQVGDTGSYEGGGPTLIELTCAYGSGACCHYDGSCEVLSFADCAISGGQYQGEGTTCDPNPCEPFYCESLGGCEEHISNVLVGDIDNSSACDGYADFTVLSTNMWPRRESEITVTNGEPHDGDQCGMWVDWNGDYDFDDANETIVVNGTPGLGPYTAVITPPSDAALGDTTLRVRIAWAGSVLPCGATAYGEVEDYTLHVCPQADFDQDCDVDIDDFNTFADCLAGPDVFDPPPGCDPVLFAQTDLDGDGDVDLADFAGFQQRFTGSP
ncbi:MAG: hypothetical protein KAY37_02565 [Phycisphaerae bacterium]|nr:hypothetical protein [Phycisphaerae bacterium]